MFDFASRDQTWWSIQAALQWISTREYKEDPYARLPFDAAAFFSGIAELHEALLEGKLQAYGSFDTASIGPLDAIIWTGSNLVAIWEEHPLMMRMHELQWPSSIIARSYESYPARAIKGPREWCGTPALGKDISDNKYLYRFVTDLVFKRVDVTSVWSTQKKVAQPVRRKKRELATRVEEALQRLTWKGASLVDSRGKASITQIAKELMKRWIEEGDDTYRAEGAVKKSVERYYKAKSSENRPQDRS